MIKSIGIIGLGLIGGSMAKAFKKYTEHVIYGLDRDEAVMEKALCTGAIDLPLDEDSFGTCDLYIFNLYPMDIKSFIRENIHRFKKTSVLIDCAGVKEIICDEMSALCSENGLYFIGGHPMAGSEKSGFDNSYPELFEGASMILCKTPGTNTVALKAAELLFLQVKFGNITITTAKEHDKIIAFTSQLAHVVSNAYIKSETAKSHFGFSAGSYKDLTRVAKLNEVLWTELFLENRENLLFEINSLVGHLQQYAKAIETEDAELLCRLLREGRIEKERIDCV